MQSRTSLFSKQSSYTVIPDIETALPENEQVQQQQQQQSSSSVPQCHGSLGWYEDVKLFAPLLTLISLFIGTIFYCWDNGWTLSTSFFYAVSTLFGVLFYLPVNKTWFGNLFTIFYYIYGAFFFAGVIGTYGGWLIAKAPEIYAQERRKLLAEEPEDLDGDGVVGLWDQIIHFKNVIIYKSGWEHHSSKYLTVGAVLLWVLVGTLYGVYYEGWTVVTSTVFSISTISAAANIAPQCVGDDTTNCKIGFIREMFLSIYMLIGCPLFTLALGQYAKFMIDRAIKRHEITILHTPITKEEFKYAANLYGDDPDVMSLGEFTILELLRLQRITMADLEQIKTLYLSIDENATGKVNIPMLVTRHWMRPYGSFDETLLSTHKGLRDELNGPFATGDGTMSDHNKCEDFDQEESHVHMLTENDRANSLPPGEITQDMYRSIGVNFMQDDEELMTIHQQYQQNNPDLTSCDRSQPSLTPHHYNSSSYFPFPPHPPPPPLLSQTPHGQGRRRASSFSLKRIDTNDSTMFEPETIGSQHESDYIPLGIKRFGFEEYNEIVVPLAVTNVLEGPLVRVDDEERHECV